MWERVHVTRPNYRQEASPSSRSAALRFVGAGPGDPELLTLRAVDLLAQADVVVTERRTRRSSGGSAGPTSRSSTARSVTTASP